MSMTQYRAAITGRSLRTVLLALAAQDQRSEQEPQVGPETARALRAVADVADVLPQSNVGPSVVHIDAGQSLADLASLLAPALPDVFLDARDSMVPVDPEDCFGDCVLGADADWSGACRDPRRLPDPRAIRRAAARLREYADEVAAGEFVHPREAAAYLADLCEAARDYSATTYRDANLASIVFDEVDVA